MLKMSIKVKNQKNPLKAINAGMKISLAEVTDIIESNVETLAPVDTGYLRSTISSAVKMFKSIIKVGAPYAVYQEFGTSKMSAANKGKGFVGYAYRLVRTRVGAIFGKNVRSKLRSM